MSLRHTHDEAAAVFAGVELVLAAERREDVVGFRLDPVFEPLERGAFDHRREGDNL